MKKFLALLLLLCVGVWAQEPRDKEEDDDDEGMDRPLERWQYFYDQRVYPGAFLPENARLKGYQQLLSMERARRGRSAAIQGEWKLVGPRPVAFRPGYAVSGRVTALAIDPRNNDVVYLGSAAGGVWKTIDGGQNWRALTDDQPSITIGALVIDPTNPDIIYAGTGEANFNADAYTGVGILKSTDGGASWTHYLGPFSRQQFGALAVHPTNGRIVIAGTRTGVYRSTDGGQNWTNTLAGVATAIFFNPTAPDTVSAALGNVNGSAANGVYKSTDAGQNWTRITGAGSIPSGTTVGRIDLVAGPGSPDTLYAAVGSRSVNGASLLGIYRTTDGGDRWTRLSSPDFCNPQCWFDLAIRVHPSDQNIIYAGGVNLIRSVNGGLTWQTLPSNGNQGGPHVDHHALVFTNDGRRLYNGNDGGVWSTDSFGSATVIWDNLNNTLAVTQYYPSLSIHPTNLNVSLGGSQDNGTHLYEGNERWRLVIGGDGGWTAIDPSSPNIAYGAYVYSEIYRTNRGDFTDRLAIDHGINPDDRIRFIATYVLDPTNPQRLYFGSQRVYRSVDGGGLWKPISPDLTNPPSPSTTSTTYSISTIAVAPTDPQVIYTGSASGSVYVTRNGGTNWEDKSDGLPTRAITKVTVDPFDAATIYVTLSGFNGGHVFRSRNFGGAWTDISTNLPDVPVNDIAVDIDIPDTLYVGTDLGAMVSSDNGATWETLGTGLPRTAVIALVLHRPTRTLRAATHGRSVWDFTLPQGSGRRPVITALSPSTRNAGTGEFTLRITGTNLGPGTKVLWNGVERPGSTGTATELQLAIPASDLSGPGRAAVTVFNPSSGGGSSIPASFLIGPSPVVANGGVVSSAAPTVARAAPGSLISVYGAGFAGELSQASGFPLPQTLGGMTVSIAGRIAPIYFVASNQMNVQVPYATELTRPATVLVGRDGQSAPVMILDMARTAPALFSLNQQGTGQGAIRIANTGLVAAPAGTVPGARPVRRGEAIEIYCTGLGAVTPAVATGDAAPSRALARTVFVPTVSVGGIVANVLFSGLTPGVAGLYQVNVQIPDGVSVGDGVPVVVNIDGVSSNTVTVAIE